MFTNVLEDHSQNIFTGRGWPVSMASKMLSAWEDAVNPYFLSGYLSTPSLFSSISCESSHTPLI